MTTKNSS